MRIPGDTPIFALNVHAGYRCANSGACCSSGWPIPVERSTHEALVEHARGGRLSIDAASASFFVSIADAPRETPVVTGCRADGTCVFYEKDRRRCAIHRQVGHDLLPVACQQFPRVSLLDDRGLFVNLSHYCPTAAAALFNQQPEKPGDDGRCPTARLRSLTVCASSGEARRSRAKAADVTHRPTSDLGPRTSDFGRRDVHIIASPPAFTHAFAFDPLDARGALPPLLTPSVLIDLDVYDRFEREVVAAFGADRSPEQAVALVTALAEALRKWSPAAGDLRDYYHRCVEETIGAARGAEPAARNWRSQDAHVRLVLDAIPADVKAGLTRNGGEGYLDLDALSSLNEGSDRRWVEPQWMLFARTIRRYLAAKAFGTWLAYQGRGVRTIAFSLTVALSLLRSLAALECGHAARPLDRALVTSAIRRCDEIWLHLASREDLGRRLSAVEDV